MKYYLYAHIRLDTGEVFYVGIGTKTGEYSTVKGEYKRAYDKSKRSQQWKDIISKTGYTISIIEESDSLEFIKKAEVSLISKLERQDKGRGALCNQTNGNKVIRWCKEFSFKLFKWKVKIRIS